MTTGRCVGDTCDRQARSTGDALVCSSCASRVLLGCSSCAPLVLGAYSPFIPGSIRSATAAPSSPNHLTRRSVSLDGGFVLWREVVEYPLYQSGRKGVSGDAVGMGDVEADGFAVQIHQRGRSGRIPRLDLAWSCNILAAVSRSSSQTSDHRATPGMRSWARFAAAPGVSHAANNSCNHTE